MGIRLVCTGIGKFFYLFASNENTYMIYLRYFPLSLLSKLQKVHNLDFQTKYHASLQLNGLQNCQLSNFDYDEIEVDLLIFQS